MSNLSIAGINISFNSLNPFFEKELIKYKTETKHDYLMTTEVKDYIELDSSSIMVNEHMFIKEEVDKTTIYYINKKSVVNHKVVYTNDFKEINIVLNSNLKDKLYMQEYLITGVYFFEIALRENVIPLHAAAISYNNKAILFSAPSGTGKSTQANLWRESIPNVEYINDDKPLLRLGEEIMVYGSPWSGKSYLNNNSTYPLDAIVFLFQKKFNRIDEIDSAEKIKLFMQNTHRSIIKEHQEILLLNLEKILKDAKMYKYGCLPDVSAVEHLKRFLFGEYNE